jgi:hypothetical protein
MLICNRCAGIPGPKRHQREQPPLQLHLLKLVLVELANLQALAAECSCLGGKADPLLARAALAAMRNAIVRKACLEGGQPVEKPAPFVHGKGVQVTAALPPPHASTRKQVLSQQDCVGLIRGSL